MGSAEAARNLLHYWIRQNNSHFNFDASNSFEATVAHSIQQISTEAGLCKCELLVTPRLQNNYGTMNGGAMAALTCIVGGAALDTLGPRSGIVTSNSMDCLSAMPVGAVVEIIGRVSAVTKSSAAVDVVLQDSASHKLIAKARYTEQAPHTIKLKATAYLTHAASAAKSAVQRLQTAAEHALQRPDSSTVAESESDQSQLPDMRQKVAASLSKASATVRAVAHRLQVAADAALRSSAADQAQSPLEQANTFEDDAKASGDTPEVALQVKSAVNNAYDKAQAAAESAAGATSSQQEESASSGQHQQQSDAQEGSAGNPASLDGSGPERAKHALLQRAAMVNDSYREDDCTCFDTTIGCTLKDIKVSNGGCIATLPVTARLADQQGHLHAGCYCSLVDLISTTALASADKRPAVSVTISVDFYAPLSVGEELEVEAQMVKAGKTLTFAEVSFRQKATGHLIAQGSHVEYSAGGAPYPESLEEYHNAKVPQQKSKL